MKRLCDATSELLRSGAAVPSFDAAVVSLVENGVVPPSPCASHTPPSHSHLCVPFHSS